MKNQWFVLLVDKHTNKPFWKSATAYPNRFAASTVRDEMCSLMFVVNPSWDSYLALIVRDTDPL